MTVDPYSDPAIPLMPDGTPITPITPDLAQTLMARLKILEPWRVWATDQAGVQAWCDTWANALRGIDFTWCVGYLDRRDQSTVDLPLHPSEIRQQWEDKLDRMHRRQQSTEPQSIGDAIAGLPPMPSWFRAYYAACRKAGDQAKADAEAAGLPGWRVDLARREAIEAVPRPDYGH